MPKSDREKFAELARKVAQQRDRRAFEQLFDFFAPRINAYLQRLGCERGQSEELTQEVMVALWHKANLFDPAKSSLATWLYRIARNRHIDSLRRNRSHLLDPHDPAFRPAENEDPDSAIDAAGRQKRIRQALENLPQEQNRLIVYAFFQGLSHSEISARTGLPLGTVKSRIRLAFARLRKALDADPYVDSPADT